MAGIDCLSVYSDGSLQGAGSGCVVVVLGLLFLMETKSLWEVGVRIGGWLSSTKTECMLCIMAMHTAAPTSPLKIYTDSQGLISGFHSFVTGVHLQPFRRLLQTRFYREWATLRQIVSHRLSQYSLLRWQHILVTLAMTWLTILLSREQLMGRCGHCHSVIYLISSSFQLMEDDCPVEGDLRAYLKLQSQFQVSITWKYRERVQYQIPYFDSVDWDSTILNLHHGNLPGSLVTSVYNVFRSCISYQSTAWYATHCIKTTSHPPRSIPG